MITYAWHDELGPDDGAEVAELLAEAAAYDAEAGFSTARPAGDGGERPDATRHLVVTMPPPGERESPFLDRLPDVRVVAYLRLDVRDATGTVQLVVRPPFRSLGIATLLLERLRDEPEGWSTVPGLRSLRGWAHGTHPAAERLSSRFGAVATRAVFKTLRPVGGSHEVVGGGAREPARGEPRALPEIVVDHDRALAPADAEARRRAGAPLCLADVPGEALLATDPVHPGAVPALLALLRAEHQSVAEARALLEAALAEARAAGARVVQLYVDALDEDFVSAARLAGFEHDQSDFLYELAVGS